MSNEKSSSKSAGAGLLVAITASLCCITPVLALVSGASGIAASFSWMEPFRPFLIGITVLVLAFAWYQKLKPKKAEVDCACDEDEKEPFMQSKLFLGMITIFAAVMLAFPYYSYVFYPEIKKDNIAVNESSIFEVKLAVEGMTCTGCEEGIKHAAMEVPGVLDATANYAAGEAIVKFDMSTSSEQEVIDAINATGYTVVSSKMTTVSVVPALSVSANLKEITLPVAGMTCTGCEAGINYKVNKLTGVSESKASFEDGQAVVKFDPSKITKEEIIKAINETGYKVEEEKQSSAGN
jgi:mercuric ion transport protein